MIEGADRDQAQAACLEAKQQYVFDSGLIIESECELLKQ
jgi:hypothetical protein